MSLEDSEAVVHLRHKAFKTSMVTSGSVEEEIDQEIETDLYNYEQNKLCFTVIPRKIQSCSPRCMQKTVCGQEIGQIALRTEISFTKRARLLFLSSCFHFELRTRMST